MADQFLTLKDLTAFHGTDDAVGLVDNIVNVAPELDRVLGRPISGTSYRARIQTALGSNGGFRSVNSGVGLSAPSFDRKRFNCFPFDVQMQVDEALLEEGQGEGETPAQVFTAFATAAVRQNALVLGRQFYTGTLNDSKGHPGLLDFLTVSRTMIDSRTGAAIDQVVDAGGTTASSCEHIWFIKMGPQGVHFIYGNGRGMTMNPWQRQQIAKSAGVYNTSWIANLFGWVGLSMANYHAVGAITNVDVTNGTTTSNGLWDDKLVAKLWAKFPITMKPDLAFCTQNAAAALQLQRTVTNYVNGGREWTKGSAPIADFPTTLPTAGNIPLIVTDSIRKGNQLTF